MIMKKISYKGVKIDMPDNLSMNCIKRIIGNNPEQTKGKDYFTVQQVIDIVSLEISKVTNDPNRQ